MNYESQEALQGCFRSPEAFDSGTGDSVQRSCNLIVKGLLTYAVSLVAALAG
jgi:hypothetical protein